MELTCPPAARCPPIHLDVYTLRQFADGASAREGADPPLPPRAPAIPVAVGHNKKVGEQRLRRNFFSLSPRYPSFFQKGVKGSPPSHETSRKWDSSAATAPQSPLRFLG